MFRFEEIEWLFLLFALPVLAGLLIWQRAMRKRSIRRLGDPELILRLIPGFSQFRNSLKSILFLFSFALVVFALAGPQFGSKLTEARREGFELIVALDVSNSMLAEDIAPNRLERAKQELSRLLDRLRNDRIGLIVFAGDAYTQIPVTSDYLSAKMFLSAISPEMVSRQGTDIASALRLAIKSFNPASTAGKAILVISDGEDHQGNVNEAVKLALEKDIRIFTIGMGTPQGVRIPIGPGGLSRDYRRDDEGNFVVTRLNEPMLADIAALGKGKYYRATSPQIGLNDLLLQLNELNKSELEYKVYSEFESQFPWLIGLAFAILLADTLIRQRKNKWLEKFNLFKRPGK